MVKRSFDVIVSMTGLVILSPLVIFCAIWIQLDSRGGVFYLQERVGKQGIIFRLFKFRTMQTHADKLAAITVGDRDPRITRAGYYLRRMKLDELPQLLNVLKGDMSLVGPRPEIRKFVAMYSEEQKHVLAVRPGITDWASIKFRNENQMLAGKEDPVEYYVKEIMPVKLALNLDYIRQQSFWVDLRIIFKTIASVFHG